MKKIILLIALMLIQFNVYALDWGGKKAPITNMYIYPSYVVVVQGDLYAGTAGCLNSGSWSFHWADFDAKTADRVYSALLAARVSNTAFRPTFHSAECGPEGHKKFSGYFNM